MALNPEGVMQKATEGMAGALAQLKYLRSLKEEVVISKEHIAKFDDAIAKLTDLIVVVAQLEVKGK